MWVCPKCGRSFKNTNQQHYCGEKPKTIDDYITGQPDEKQPYLRLLRAAISECIPEAQERISWSMPTFWESITSFNLRPIKTTSDYMPESKRSLPFQKGLRTIKRVREPYSFPLINRCQ